MAAMTDVAETKGGQCQCQPCLAKARTRQVRAWRWFTGLDLTKPPAPIMCWALLLILGLTCWAAGIPLDLKDWLAPIIVAGVLIFPDVAGFGFGGIRLDLRKAQDAITSLRWEVNAQARAAAYAGAIIAIGDKAIERSGFNTMGTIRDLGQPGAAVDAQPLSTAATETGARDEDRVP